MPTSKLPIGFRFIQYLIDKGFPRGRISNRVFVYKWSVLILTFITYTCYHASRKPLSVVKSYFTRKCDGLVPPPGTLPNDTYWCDWAPFYGPDGSSLLGVLDSAFLFAYAAAMFISGFIAERVNLRTFLAVGMLASGLSCILLGLTHPLEIHSLWYYIAVQIFGGIVQTTGWPGVVAVMGNWFGKGNRGLIFGLWNSHTSVGNIIGALIASSLLEIDWALSFSIPGVMMIVFGFINCFFLLDSPRNAGCEPPISSSECHIQENSASSNDLSNDEADSDTDLLLPQRSEANTSTYGNDIPLHVINRSSDEANSDINISPTQPENNAAINDLSNDEADSDTEFLLPVEQADSKEPSEESEKDPVNDDKAVDIIGALKIPGVIEFSLCLFFSKLVNYTFLYWLPFYINSSTTYSESLSADLSTIFDVGGILGGIFAGAISDYSGKSAGTCALMLILAIPLLFLYDEFGSSSLGLNIGMLALAGFFVNGPYALITTAVSADLGTHESLLNNAKALATVTAIIDGTGSLGAAVGPLIAGFVFKYGWKQVFYMLMMSNVFALMTLFRLVKKELTTQRNPSTEDWSA